LAELSALNKEQEKTKQYLEIAKGLGFKLKDKENQKSCDVYMDLCESLQYSGEYKESTEFCNKTLECLKKFPGPKIEEDLYKKGKASELLADNWATLGNFDEAIKNIEYNSQILD